MHLTRIDLNLFVVFDAIYAERNLTRAAAVLNVTQPAVSNALSRLRDTFEDRLFEKAGRSMVPTPVAQNLIGPVRQALRLLQSSVEQRDRFDPATAEKVFNIAARELTSGLLLPDLMRRLPRLAPRVKVQCHEVDRGQIATELAAGTLDLAIDIPNLDKARLNSIELQRDRYVCVLRRGHPAAADPLTLDRFLALQHVTASSRRRGRGYVDLALARLGRQTDTVLRLQDYPSAFHVVTQTDLALCAPASFAERYDVDRLELPFEVAPLVSLLYWHKNAEHDGANLWLRGLIADIVGVAAPAASVA